MTPEAKVKANAVSVLKKLKIYYFFPIGGYYAKAGVPDIVCCAAGAFVGIECKTGSNKPTALQLREMGSIRDAGGFTFVVNEENIDGLESELQKILHRM